MKRHGHEISHQDPSGIQLEKMLKFPVQSWRRRCLLLPCAWTPKVFWPSSRFSGHSPKHPTPQLKAFSKQPQTVHRNTASSFFFLSQAKSSSAHQVSDRWALLPHTSQLRKEMQMRASAAIQRAQVNAATAANGTVLTDNSALLSTDPSLVPLCISLALSSSPEHSSSSFQTTR